MLPIPVRYRLLAHLGRGASGDVYRVHDTLLDRPLALKRLRPDAAPGRAVRFLHEARVTASLQHPGIVPIHEVGEDAAGLWYTMRELEGGTLADAVAAGMGTERRLDAFLQACDAVAAAHTGRVVHLDLKPQNIAVGRFGEVVVLDWGVARRLDEPGTPPIVGTPGWMAPEQARGEPLGPPADVYSLGRVLEWLVPLPAAEVRAIVARCLDPDPGRRYPDASALAEDVRRWRDGRRIDAMRYTITADIRRFVEHHRAVTAVAVVGVVGVLTGLAGAVYERAQAMEGLAADLAGRAQTAVRSGDLVDAGVLGAASLALRESPGARGAVLAASSAGLPRLVWQLDRPLAETAVQRPDDGLGEPPPGRSGPEHACTAADLHPDGVRLACGTADGVLLFDTRDGSARRFGEGRVGAVVFSPDGARLAYGRVVPDGAVVELDLASGAELRRFAGHLRGTWSVEYLPGDRLLSSGDDQWLRIWPTGPEITGADSISFQAGSPDGRHALFSLGRWADLETGDKGVLPEGLDTLVAAWSPSGARLVGSGGTRDADLRLWDRDGALLTRLSGAVGGVRALSFVTDTLLGSADGEGRVGLWSLGRTRTHLSAHLHDGRVDTLRAAGGHLLTTGQDLRIRLWEIAPDRVWGQTTSERIAPEIAWIGGKVVVGQEHAALRRYDADLTPIDTLADVYNPQLAELRGHVLSADMRAALAIDGVEVRPLTRGLYLTDLAVDADRVFLLERGDFNAVEPWSAVEVLDADGFGQLDRWVVPADTTFIAARDGRVLTGGPRAPARLTRWPGGDVEVELPADTHGYSAGVLGADTWVVGGTDGSLRVSGETVHAHPGAVTAVALSPDGRLLATGGADLTVRLWSLPDLQALATLPMPPATPTSLVFVDGGVVVALSDGAVRRVDLAALDRPARELSSAFCRTWGMRLVGAAVVPVPAWSDASCG